MSAITPKIFPQSMEYGDSGLDAYTGISQARPLPPNAVPNLIPLTDMMPTVASPNNGANTGQGSGGGGGHGGGGKGNKLGDGYDPFWGGGIGVKPHLGPDAMKIAPPAPPLGGDNLATPIPRNKNLNGY